MLVLSRKVGERIVIGEDIVIFVNEAKDSIARLGIEAPRHIKIRRYEHFEADKRREAEVKQ